MRELETTYARMKSYTGTALLVFCLYLFFFFPGFFVNYMYFREARRMERIAGTRLPGVELLNIMMFVSSASLLTATCIVIAITAYVLSSFFWR